MSRQTRKDLIDAVRKVRKAIDDLTAEIEALPDNHRIRRLSPNCFVMSSKDLGDNWSPAHHDFRIQYRMIAKQLRSAKTHDVLAKLRRIINEGKIQQSGLHHVRLHPDVVAHLKTILG